eukprot:m.260591 g.260591  ORF g.260591 m.260591 type:complete len:142 (+) comp19218_c0_seq11:476-901(+)
MYLLTHPYFLTYFVFGGMLLRRLRFWAPQTGIVKRCTVIAAMSYTTALMETWTISGYPNYTYPDPHAMLVYGSAFYALLFVVAYPTSSRIDEFGSRWTVANVATSAFACAMEVMVLYDAWRLFIGPVVASADSSRGVQHLG